MAKEKDQRYFYLKGRIPYVRKALSKSTIEVFENWKTVYRLIMDNDRFHLHEDEPVLQYSPVERVDRAIAVLDKTDEGFARVRSLIQTREVLKKEYAELIEEYHRYRG